MPMAINSPEEYEKVVNVSWFSHEKAVEELVYDCTIFKSQI